MHILVVNSGSSSIKFSFYETGEGTPLCRFDGEIDGFLGDAGTGIHAVFAALERQGLPTADAVGYRVVHPGARLTQHTPVTEEVLRELDAAAEFAPLHDPVALAIIRATMARLPAARHYACFDTVFHETMPKVAKTYPIPAELRAAGVRRYGFHGLSCESIVRQMRQATCGFPHRAVVAHLGSGCSVTALVDGESVDTTMGLTPTGGVVMGTRPGDLDPGLVLYLLRKSAGDGIALEQMLNHDCGMVALSGMKNDVKALRQAGDNADARLALDVFTRSVRKAIGGYAWLLGGLDAVIFAGGIGEHDGLTRSEVLSGLGGLGVTLDNADDGKGMRRISDGASRVAVWVVPAQEDLTIALHVERMSFDNARQPSDGVME